MIEQVFDVRGPDGLVRRGVWCAADPAAGGQGTGTGTGTAQSAVPAPKQPTAVILLSAGLKYRVGAHRFNVLLARQLAAWGYSSLRLDPLGVGESDGCWGDAAQEQLWQRAERGCFVPDALLAAQAVRERFGVSRVLMGGLCGGAVTALMAAAHAPQAIQGLISLGLPVLPTPQAEDDAPALPPDVARRLMSRYARKLLSPDAWARVLRGQSNWRGISRTVQRAISGPTLPSAALPDAARPESRWALQAFEQAQRHGVPHLMIFGGADNRWLEFESTLLAHVLRGQYHGPHHDVELIPHASHELHFDGFKQQAMSLVGQWLAARF